jgi:hypothetical protein
MTTRYFDIKKCFRCGKKVDFDRDGNHDARITGHFHKNGRIYTATWCSDKCLHHVKMTKCRHHTGGCCGKKLSKGSNAVDAVHIGISDVNLKVKK